MRQLSTLLSVVFISTAVSHSIEKRESNEKRVVCYYTNWSVYRPGTAKYNPQNINPYLCTHLIYAFGGLDRENGLRPYDKYQDIEQGGYAKFTGLKSYNKNLKTMLAIGGWNEGSARFSPLVADDERRKEFVKNVVKFLRVNHFDGLDLDWEYPAFRDGGKPRDRDNYAQLVQELREEFDREHEKTGRPRLLLTMAVPAGIEYIDKGYDVPKLNRYLDFMNILSYDYHSAFEPAVNHHSPLFPLEEDNEYNFDAQLSIDYTVKHYLKLGADRDKLVLGIPTYGRSYTLFNPDSTDIGAPADGPGEQGDATREKGYLAYYEICQALKDEDDWTVVQPKPGAMGPYAFKNNQWVGYDDMDIAKKKSQYVNDQSLGGIMFWSIDNDDFRGKCHDRAYPLIEAAKEALYASSGTSNNVVSSSNKKEKTSGFTTPNRRVTKPSKSPPKVSRTTTTTPSPPSKGLTTPEPPTTPDPGSDFVCKDEGFFPHPRDCKKYFWCLDSGPSNLGIVAHQFTCPSGLFFNKAADSCDYTRNVLCNKKDKSEKTTTAAPKTTASTTKSSGSKIITTTTTTTTTTTEAPIPEEEYEEEEEEHEQEDPEAIKQLIQLIKKLGGVAELEKQLEGAGASGVSTPAIPRSLYKKVLTPQRPRYQSPYRNGPSGPQNEGLAKEDDGSSYRRDKPQYVTIRRERPSTEAPEEEKVEVVTPSSRYKYTSIIRNRPPQYEVKESTEEEEEEPVVRAGPTTPRYQTIERSRPAQPIKEDEEEEERFKPKYSSIQRNRPTTVEAFIESTTPRYVTLRRQRPQSEQQQEESTIKHTGETIVIEQEEEIKPIEIDVEEPIPTSVRPKIKVGTNRVRVGFRRPVTPSTLRSRSSTTTESNLVSERPTAKFLRRRVQSKFRPESRNTTAFVSTAATSPAPDLYETTAKQRRFEFPRRSSKVNINSLPQQAALVGTSAPFVEIQDNHSDESLHEVDTERLENQESLEGDLQGLGVEDATLPDLANVAVVAIQSLATAPPSTETFAPVTVTNRRRVSRPSTTTTTTTPQPTVAVRRGPPRPFSKVRPGPTTIAPKSQFITRHKPYDDLAPDYEDYYAEPVEIPLSGKVRIHNDGYIECLDIGNFPHPFACKKFISCAKMENEHLLGWEYTCPRGLSFDPIGGICNWSAGLGCKE
ncbi:mucin-2 isoform X2 [Macrosteles quadrilineatus]|uniref:mucin-2 isoform X2 n=1 Tax=Macrosteles quadrilineatus TaxID=74068 RepID=UPI0023E2DBFD|nr:mucin-2 isoform X2 [Macrosteles quadrilineatus]